MFGPYTPLQQLDLLADSGTKSYVAGSTNSLLLQHKNRYSDILVNVISLSLPIKAHLILLTVQGLQLDDDTIAISSPSLRSALALSAADRRWIDFLVQAVNDTWDDAHPDRPKTHGFMGSEEFIRLQFEEYLLALLSCMKYHEELDSLLSPSASSSSPSSPLPTNGETTPRRSESQLRAFNIEGDPALEFNAEFLAQWKRTPNYALFYRLTSDALLYSIVEPRHPCAGGLTIDDIQRRLSQQVADLHLDERVREGRDLLNRHLSTGQKKVTAAISSFWADIDAMREAQQKRNEEQQQRQSMTTTDELAVEQQQEETSATSSMPSVSTMLNLPISPPRVDLAQTQASVSSVGQKASTYLSSWTAWAGEKRKEWQEKSTLPSDAASGSAATTTTTGDGGGDHGTAVTTAAAATNVWSADDSPHEEEEDGDEKEEEDKAEGKKGNNDDEFEPIPTTGREGVVSSSEDRRNAHHDEEDDEGTSSVSDTEFYDTEEVRATNGGDVFPG